MSTTMVTSRHSLRTLCCFVGVVGALVAGCGSTAKTVATTRPPTATTVASTVASTIPVATSTFPATTSTEVATTIAVTTTSIEDTTTVATTAAPTTTAAPHPTLPVTDAPAAAGPLPTPAAPPVDPNGAEAKLQIGSIEIPKIGVTKPMFEGVTLTTLNRGPGHWPGTALPGQAGNVVIGGHRVSHDKPFRNIDQLVPGDDVYFTTAAGRFDYKVVSSEVVTPDQIRIIDQTPDSTATLFACTPPGSTSHRLVVHLVLST
jgi:sortase A